MESAAESSSAPQARLMPGSFDPLDYIACCETPIEPAGDDTALSEDTNRENPWSARNLPELDLRGVSWEPYSPPAALHKTPNVTSDILREIAASSIEIVRANAAAEVRRKKAEEEEEEKRRQEEEAKSKIPKTPRPGEGEAYLPVIIPPEKPSPLPSPPPSPQPGPAMAASDRPSTAHSRPARTLRGIRPRDGSADDLKAGLRKLFKKSTNEKSRQQDRKGKGKEVVRPVSPASSFKRRRPVPQDYAAGFRRIRGVLRSSLDEGPVEGSVKPAEPVECVSCLDEFPPHKTVRVPCHSYCFDCFASLISTSVQNEQQWPPKCCLNEIPIDTILRYVPRALKKQFNERSMERRLPPDQRIYCGRPGCSLWVRPDHIDPRDAEGRCERGHWTCIMCRAPSHKGSHCPQDENMALTNQLAEEQGWKQCQNCHAIVEHRDACRHMTCRCGYQFCYVCNARWHTCSCTEGALQTIKADARVRREAREMQERREAEDLRAALAEIQEFERNEALRVEMQHQEEEDLRQQAHELLDMDDPDAITTALAQAHGDERREALRIEIERQAEERMEEERQQRELEERVLRESIRRRDLELKFEELRKGLDLLHDLQLVMLEQQHEDATRALSEQADTARIQLGEKQDKERSQMKHDIASKIREKDRTFINDFFARSLAETKMMDEYRRQLHEYWQGHPDGTIEVEKAMAPIQKRMEGGQAAWRDWKDAQLKAYGARLEERQVIKEELMDSAVARLDDQLEDLRARLARRKVAEKQWVRLVVLERERLLRDMEVDEVEGDADSLFAGDTDNSEGTAAEESAAGMAEDASRERADDSVGLAL